MKAITIITLWASLLLQSPNSFAQTSMETPLAETTNVSPFPIPGHLITFTASYGTGAISIFYPDRTELIYMKIRKSRWIGPANTYCLVNYVVTYEDGTRKHFEDVKLFRKQDAMQRVITDHLSKITELGYELIETNMTDFEMGGLLKAIFRFKG
ncbi:MAG: hypothetical protein ACPG49_05290 [Chitinophagales bacterium]